MKKYWKMGLVSVVSLLAISTFYIYSAATTQSLPQIVIQHDSGDADYIESMHIRGTISVNQDTIFTGVQITADETKYQSELSLLDQLAGLQQPLFVHLVNEYRGFMRGKMNFGDYFYEDDDYVVYAANHFNRGLQQDRNYKLTISLLDKTTSNSTSFEVSVPNATHLQWLRVHDVQKLADELHIIAETIMFRGDSALHVYTVDIASQAIVSAEQITTFTQGEDEQHAYFNIINSSDPTQPQTYVLFQQVIITYNEPARHNETLLDVAITREREEEQRFIAYNLQTKEQKDLTALLEHEFANAYSEHMSDQAFMPSDIHGPYLYFMHTENDEISVHAYHLENEQVEQTITIQTPGQVADRRPMIFLTDGLLYMIAVLQERETFSASLTVTEMSTGESVYEGLITEKEPYDREYHLRLFDMFVK